MTGEPLLVAIVGRLSRAIEEEADHEKRHKLKDARELVRDVLWGTGVMSLPVAPEATIPDPAANRERHP